MRVAAYMSGNMAAETCRLAVDALSAAGHLVTVLEDGNVFVPPMTEGLTVKTMGVGGAGLPEVDLLIVVPRTPSDTEGALVQHYSDLGVRTLAICSDIGSGTEKYRRFTVLPDHLLMPDSLTHDLFARSGQFGGRLVACGNLYYDHLHASVLATPVCDEADVAWLSVPNRHDWDARGAEQYYSEIVLDNSVLRSLEASGLRVRVRHHPYHRFYEERSVVVTSDIVDFLARSRVVGSTYSTSLVAARLLGCGAFSLQPEPAPIIREHLFSELDIPVVRDYTNLPEVVGQLLATPQPALKPFWYNPGCGKSELTTIVESLVR